MADLGKNPAREGHERLKSVTKWCTLSANGLGNRVPTRAGESTKPVSVLFMQTTRMKDGDL